MALAIAVQWVWIPAGKLPHAVSVAKKKKKNSTKKATIFRIYSNILVKQDILFIRDYIFDGI